MIRAFSRSCSVLGRNLLSASFGDIAVDGISPKLAVAQFMVFTRQLPLMYALLVTNTMFLSLVFYKHAPFAMTVIAPAILAVACAARLTVWWRSRHTEVTPERANRELRRTISLTAVLGVCFSAWSLSLYPYGDVYARAYIAFYMSITVIGCIFCLI